MDPYVAKMFFLQVDEGFWLSWCLIKKKAKLTFNTVLSMFALIIVAELRNI